MILCNLKICLILGHWLLPQTTRITCSWLLNHPQTTG
jgi:antibiotic biosynthesis monooxygenase (ABM) superfamily enzyme